MYVGGGEAFMLMHETRMHENYDLKWGQTWPHFFIFYRRKREDPEKNPLLSRLLFLSFFSVSLLKKRKKRMRNKKANMKEENRKKENRKRLAFFYCQQV